MTILGLAELFKTMNPPCPTQTDPTVTLFAGLFIWKYTK